jgi:hypothetical protein
MYQPHYQNSWALVIGINVYEHAAPLSYACNDADDVASVLINELSFPADHVIVLKDADATKQAILENYFSLSKKAGNDDDRALIFFAGHGMTVQGSRGPIGYLLPVDGNGDNYNTLIRWDDLTRNAEVVPAKHILFIIDACYSGLAIHRAITPGTQRFISDMLQRFSRQVITAGKADETVADGGGPSGKNSIFTGYLIEGLRGAASDANGVLTANLIMHYVYEKVGQDVRSHQTPHYGHIEGDGDFILRSPQDEHLTSDGEQDFLVQTVKEVPETATESEAAKPRFAVKHGYGDAASANFGRNDWSARLGESKFPLDGWTRDVTKAFSWLSLIAEPVPNQAIAIDIKDEFVRLGNRRSDVGEHYEAFQLPHLSMTTIDSAVFYGKYGANQDFWGHYLRVDRAGNIEYADSTCVFADFAGTRRFEYVRIVGIVWQFMFFAKDVLTHNGYRGGIRLLLNLVGTRDTILDDFANEQGENGRVWAEPFERGGLRNSSSLNCPTPNLQMGYRLLIGTLNEGKSWDIIDDVATQLGLAYNHRPPLRCFNYGTTTFPWRQYMRERSYCSDSQW